MADRVSHLQQDLQDLDAKWRGPFSGGPDVFGRVGPGESNGFSHLPILLHAVVRVSSGSIIPCPAGLDIRAMPAIDCGQGPREVNLPMSSPETLVPGTSAPDFSAPASGGREISLSGLRGRKVVLYFYPKDDTPGCTTEGQEFAALYPEFQAAGAEVIGVSRDSIDSHEKFAHKYGFPFLLVSDASEALCRAYDVIREKKNYGKTYLGIERSTFVIDREGRLAWVQRKVRAAGHAAKVLETVHSLP